MSLLSEVFLSGGQLRGPTSEFPNEPVLGGNAEFGQELVLGGSRGNPTENELLSEKMSQELVLGGSRGNPPENELLSEFSGSSPRTRSWAIFAPEAAIPRKLR